MADRPAIRPHVEGTVIEVRVKLRAKASDLLGMKAGVLEVAVAAAPVDGAANEELIRTLAAHFSLGRRAVRVVAGASARHKRILLAGLGPAEVEARLERIG
jgi:uncharacterized protein (TIGR00251 family)